MSIEIVTYMARLGNKYKRRCLRCLGLFSFLFACHSLDAQHIGTVSISPTSPMSCNAVSATVTGSFFCANASLSPNSTTMVGNSIFVNINIVQPSICLPAVVPFPTQTVDLGLIPAGSYTLTVQTFTNGVLSQQSMSNLIVVCCDEIVLDAPLIASGTYEASDQITASGTVQMGDTIELRAANQIQLLAGFQVEHGGFFSAFISPCPATTPMVSNGGRH